MWQITTTQNLVAIKEVRHAGQQVVQIRIQVSHVEAVLERWSLKVYYR